MAKEIDEQQISKQHDAKIFSEGQAIFSRDDLRELINIIYSEYQYKGTQFDRLGELINYLGLENNKFLVTELADQSDRLIAYLTNFGDFLKLNFHRGNPSEDGEPLYLFLAQGTSFETEAFLTEFQMLSMEAEKAYRDYCAAVKSKLLI